MGHIDVKGNAERTVNYDLMKIVLSFQAKEKRAVDASEKVMHDCEEFLKTIQRDGFDISKYFSENGLCRSVIYIQERFR